ncbi:hypothetical protein NEOC95_001792 [Neochlamydia sp. AcF95]|nr:hypothetical protein [Neochlamydia sp. AcF95]
MAIDLNAKVAEMKRQKFYCQLLKPIEFFLEIYIIPCNRKSLGSFKHGI